MEGLNLPKVLFDREFLEVLSFNNDVVFSFEDETVQYKVFFI